MATMFFNKKEYAANEKLLTSLKAAVKKSHQNTYKRVTNDFDGANNFLKAQYIGAKFREVGFGYPSNDEQIKKCVGIEKALQTLNTYGGNNFRQAYFNKFANQFESSKQRLHDLNLTTGELFRAEQNKRKAYDEIVKKRNDAISGLFSESFKKQLPWTAAAADRKRKGGKGGNVGDSNGDDDDNDDDGDGNNGDGKKREKEIQKFLHKEMRKYMIFSGKYDDNDDGDDEKGNVLTKTETLTPKQLYEKNAFTLRPNWIDPISGEYREGYDNIDSTFLRSQLNDSKKNILIKSGVDTLRAGTNKAILRNNPAVRSRITEFISKKEDGKGAFKVTQFGEPLSDVYDDFEDRRQSQRFRSDLTLGSLLDSNNRIRREPNDDNYEWDHLATVYEQERDDFDDDNNDNREAVAITRQKQQIGEDEDNDYEETPPSRQRNFVLDDQAELKDVSDRRPQGNSGRLAIRTAGLSNIIENMNNLGYDDDQVSEFIEHLDMNYDEFAGLHLDEQVGEITKTLDRIGHARGSDPMYSQLTAEENERVLKQQRLRKKTGANSNLMSEEFALEKKLHTLTTLSSKLSRPIETKKPAPTDPGEEDDPYRSVLEEIDGDSKPPPPPPSSGSGAVAIRPVSSIDENLNEKRQEYFEQFESRLNQFVGNTPLQIENSVALNNFLRKAMVEDPKEIEAVSRRKEEEKKLKESLREKFNPNKTSTKDAVTFDNLNTGGASNGPELKFQKKVVLDTDEIEITAERNSDNHGKPLIRKVVKNAIDHLKDREESTIGGLLGNINGTNSFTNFTPDDYYKLCGVDGEENFQSLLDQKIRSDDSKNNPLFSDQTKLYFLPGEKRPNMTFPPLSILPTNNEHQIIGATPLFGSTLDEDQKIVDGETPASVTTMEIDTNLLNTSEQSIITDTTLADVNVVEEDQRNGNYAARLRKIQTNRDKAFYVVQMLIKDAVLCGRLDQTMLANQEVVQICQVLLHVVEILLNRQSNYFNNFQATHLELINVDTVENGEFGYFTILNNGVYALNLFEVSRNVFNLKMEPITEAQFRSATDDEMPNLRIFKQFMYFVMRENEIRNPDSLIVFRSESRFRQGTIVKYQNLDPQMRTKNFFLLLDNYLLQLHISGNTSIAESFKFNNLIESDLHRRFNALVLEFMASTNASMEQLLARSPLALLFTEAESRMQNSRALSYRRSFLPLVRNLNNSNPQSDYAINSDKWNMLFHGRENANYNGMTNEDSPPSGGTLVRLINNFRDSKFAVGSAQNASGSIIEGGHWQQIEPTTLMDILVNAFVEHQVIPPLRGTYVQTLSNFFSVLTADPIQQMFVKHLKIMYRRGWRKENLARQAAYVFVEHYVALVLLIVQRALLQNDSSLSTTASFASSIERFSPMVKLQDVLREVIVAFDPISYLADEASNRDSHEQKYLYHFKRYSEYVSEIIESYELWLQEEVDGYRINASMPRSELFLRIISAGGYEESRSNYLESIQTNVAEADKNVATKTQLTIPTSANTATATTQFTSQEKEMKEIEITIINTGTQTMPLPKAQVTQPIKVKSEPLDERTKVHVDASHPEISNMSTQTLMNSIRAVVLEELELKINKVTVAQRNENISSSAKKYTAYATPSLLTESNIGADDDAEEKTILYNVEVQPSDSASQVDAIGRENDDEDLASLNTIDYNNPGMLVYESSSKREDSDLKPVSRRSTLLTISEPTVITGIGGNVDRVLDDNNVLSNVTKEYDVPKNKLISSELDERIKNTIGADYENDEFIMPPVLTNTHHGKSEMFEQSLSNNQKDKFSATKEIEETMASIDETIKKIAVISEKQIIAGSKKHQARSTGKIKISKKHREDVRKKAQTNLMINKRRGITSPKSVVPPYDVAADDPEYTKKEKSRLNKGVEETRQIISALEEKHVEENKLSAQEKDYKNKIMTAIMQKKKLSMKRKLPATSIINDTRLIRRSKLQRIKATKRLREKQLTGRKVKMVKKQQIEEKSRMEQVNDALDRLKQIERNRPERLVTKPLSPDSPFVKQGRLSTFATSSNEKKNYDDDDDDDDDDGDADSYFSKTSTKKKNSTKKRINKSKKT